MPLIKIQNKGLKKQSTNIAMMLICSSFLIACGSGGETTRITPPTESDPIELDPKKFYLTAKMPMQMVNAQFKIKLAAENKTIFEDKKFNGFDLIFSDLNFADISGKIIIIEISGDHQTYMYDPILDKFVPFIGKMHYIGQVNSQKARVLITPISEAIFQRTITRSNQFDYENPDLSLIRNKHILKSASEASSTFRNAFSSIENFIPNFSNHLSITSINYSENNVTQYSRLFLGLGYMLHFYEKNPNTKNTYLELSQSIGTDFRDGFLDGRSIIGDKTTYTALVTAPINTNPQNNSYQKIGTYQKNIRDEFSNHLKLSTIKYVEKYAMLTKKEVQVLRNIENNALYFDTSQTNLDQNTHYRWLGAGDYRPAIGLKNADSCSNGANPCRQGLNVDDLETHVNDVEYLIGTHQLNTCTIHIFPSGNVSITKGDKVYRSSINRDLSDNLQQVTNGSNHYVLNVGASENKPAYFLQFEIKDMQITKARTGYNFDIYSTSIETPEMDCGT